MTPDMAERLAELQGRVDATLSNEPCDEDEVRGTLRDVTATLTRLLSTADAQMALADVEDSPEDELYVLSGSVRVHAVARVVAPSLTDAVQRLKKENHGCEIQVEPGDILTPFEFDGDVFAPVEATPETLDEIERVLMEPQESGEEEVTFDLDSIFDDEGLVSIEDLEREER
jgi:hypothetical protein